MTPTLENIRTARDSARRRRDHTAGRLKRLVLKLCSRVEAYEHELALLSRIEGQLVADGRATDAYPLPLSAGRTETRFKPETTPTAITTGIPASDAASAFRRATPTPLSAPPHPALGLERYYPAGDGY